MSLPGPDQRRLLPQPGAEAQRPLDLLVLDDDSLVLQLVARRLRDTDCSLCGLVSCDEAEVLLREQTPANLLLDYRMPGRDGLAFLRDCRAQSLLDTTRVFVMSSAPLPGDIEYRFLECGARPVCKSRLVERDYLVRLLAA